MIASRRDLLLSQHKWGSFGFEIENAGNRCRDFADENPGALYFDEVWFAD
jgi:hypothetical protein